MVIPRLPSYLVSLLLMSLKHPTRWAPIADLLVIVIFVAVGRNRHGLDSTGTVWFLTVLWPFALAWMISGVAVRLYASADRTWLRLIGTIIATAILGGLLRGFTGHTMFSVFNIVFSIFILFGTAGWRSIRLLTIRVRSN
ncbi:unannotated protein [freshwater metagenome]|uniref:Unannotated protein n=2 Tax=freshwater metagenome TaxID=449393 RepID=A0A6J7R3J7_9ZZZZ